MRYTKDTGNYRIVRKEEHYNGKTTIWFEPQKEVKLLWFSYYKPISTEEFDGHLDTYEKPYSCRTENEAINIIKQYKDGELENKTLESVVYEERI